MIWAFFGKITPVLLLGGGCGAVIWHVFSWHRAGKYEEMHLWLSGGNGYLTAFYDVGLVLGFGLVLGLFTGRVMEALTGLDKRDGKRRK